MRARRWYRLDHGGFTGSMETHPLSPGRHIGRHLLSDQGDGKLSSNVNVPSDLLKDHEGCSVEHIL